MRLVYFHPPGILQYHDLVDRWVEQTARLKTEGRFRWYTMTELANFLNSRKQVKWRMSDNGGLITVEATHPQTLDHETWRIPASKFAEPKIVLGSAKVVRDDDAWMIIAGDGKDLRFETETADQMTITHQRQCRFVAVLLLLSLAAVPCSWRRTCVASAHCLQPVTLLLSSPHKPLHSSRAPMSRRKPGRSS